MAGGIGNDKAGKRDLTLRVEGSRVMSCKTEKKDMKGEITIHELGQATR